MKTEIPIFRQIKFDTDRSGRELQVFWASCELLDLVEARPLPFVALEKVLKQQQRDAITPIVVSKSTISTSLTRLEEAGYLVRTVDDGRVLWRVPLSRVPRDVATVAASDARRRRSVGSIGVVSEAID